MLKIKLNERPFDTADGTTLFGLRDRVKPKADVVILNGAAMNADAPLKNGDEVSLITRGEMPSADELEALMASRHTPGVHAKLKAATVGIAGLGGLGSAIAVALARVGVGKLIVADFDVVEPSNLNRQPYFVDQIGMLKTNALVSNLRKINPYVQVETHAVKLTPDNLQLFGDVDVMIEAFDRADRPANTMPFLEISKAMGRGVGYAGEGDVLTAALVGALARTFAVVSFTEIFCADWTGGNLFLSHMGEISPALAGDVPRVTAKPFFSGGSLDPAILTCAVKPGPGVFVNLAPGPGDTFALILSPVEVLAENAALHPALRDVVRCWVRPPVPVAEFLEAYSRAGGTHHSALVLGDRMEAIAAFGQRNGLEVVRICA